MKLNAGLNQAWSTPIYKASLSVAECEKILDEILLVEDVHDPLGDAKSNLLDNSPSLKIAAESLFNNFFEEAYDVSLNELDYDFRGWLTGSSGGYSMDLHNHTGAQFVSVFYLMSQEQDAGGDLVIEDPRFNANRGYNGIFQEQFNAIEHLPETGDVLIFPGYAYHFVRTYHSKLRIAAPVDIFIRN